MKLNQKVLPLALCFCLLSGLLTGCGNNNSGGNENAGGANKEASANKTGSGTMDSIVRVTSDWPTYTDPGVGSDFSDTIAMVNIYDPLVFPDLEGSPIAHVAKEWSVSDDGLEYTFIVRDDVKFHSGNMLTAEDIAYSMNRMLEIGEGYAYLYKGVVKEVTALDDTTVKFVLDHKFGPFVNSLTRFHIVDSKTVIENYDLSVKTYGDKGDYGKTWLLTNDAGSGPYAMHDVKLEEYILAKKFDDYFNGWEENAPEYFKLSGATEPVSVRTAIANKELEITDELQPIENYNTMDTFDGVKVIGYESGNTMNVCLNTAIAPTDDIHYRKALAYAFDYDTVLEDIYPGSVRCQGPVSRIIPGANTDITPYEFNMEKAKEELAKSKYANDPSMMTLNLTWCAEVPEQEKIALMLYANLSQLGINVNITKKPFGSMIADAQNVDTTAHLTFVNTNASYFEAGAVLKTRYHSSSTGTWEQMEWLRNADIDAKIDDALATIDQKERFEKYRQVQAEINELCPTIWAFNWIEKRAYQEGYMAWPPADMLKEGKNFVFPMGYSIYVHDMKVYTDKK